MTKKKKIEIIKWMCKHWQSEDVMDDAVTKFGRADEVIDLCAVVSEQIDEYGVHIPEKLMKKLKI